jgi:hypothetical protein
MEDIMLVATAVLIEVDIIEMPELTIITVVTSSYSQHEIFKDCADYYIYYLGI